MNTVKKIKAYEIMDSRGYPTIEAMLTMSNGIIVTTSIPAGTSIGKYEAVELRDQDLQRFEGKGVSKAVSFINELIGPKLSGASPLKQKEVDYWLIKADGTQNKSKLGANTCLAISQLMVKAGAADLGVPIYKYINSLYNESFKQNLSVAKIPNPMFNVINGGKHANMNTDFQEFHVIPSSSLSFAKAYRMGVEIFHELEKVLIERHANVSVGEEGGFAPSFNTNIDALEVIKEAVAKLRIKIGLEVFLGLDVAASVFFKDGKYIVKDRPHPQSPDEYLKFIKFIVDEYSILVLEDPFAEDEWSSWQRLNESLGERTYLVGDDLLTTSKVRLQRAIKEKACTTIVIKPNQIGTITETLEVIDLARKNNFNYLVSHRSGDTADSFIADFSVGVQSDFVKFGAPSRGERVAKYNRLLEIEKDGL